MPLFPELTERPQSRQRIKYGHEARGTRNQELLCWREPAAFQQTVSFALIV
jgi:hypothetical protein